MTLFDRIGVDVGHKLPLAEALEWAAAHRVRFVDVQLDSGDDAVDILDKERARRLRASCERHGIRLGLHTASAVNVAETAPYLGEAVERYLNAYVDAAAMLGARWVVMHAGFHFGSDREARMHAGRERLRRVVDYAERNGVVVLLENLNKEPPEAEVHYLAHTIEEWRFYFEAIRSPAFALSFTVNHAHLVPEGIAGFIAALDIARIVEVRLADCWRNRHEVHLMPGMGDIDFGDTFARLEAGGFRGHYMNAFGSLDDMLAGRDRLVQIAGTAGIAA